MSVTKYATRYLTTYLTRYLTRYLTMNLTRYSTTTMYDSKKAVSKYVTNWVASKHAMTMNPKKTYATLHLRNCCYWKTNSS